VGRQESSPNLRERGSDLRRKKERFYDNVRDQKCTGLALSNRVQGAGKPISIQSDREADKSSGRGTISLVGDPRGDEGSIFGGRARRGGDEDTVEKIHTLSHGDEKRLRE